MVQWKNTKDFYNKTAGEWADKGYQDESLLPYLTYFMKQLPEHPRVLDLCCGTGCETMRLQQLGAEAAGIDFSETSIEIARQHNSTIPFYVDNMLNDYSYAGSFDGAVVIAGLVHLHNQELRSALGNLHGVLREKGKLLVSVKDGTGKSDKQSYTTIDGENYDRDFYFHTLEELKLSAEGMFDFIEEVYPNEESPWKKYLFQKRG